jgi:hypothetical protein
MRICFLSSQMNAIRGFSAPPNSFRLGHPSKMRRHEEQEQRNGMSGAHSMTDVENLRPIIWRGTEPRAFVLVLELFYRLSTASRNAS